MATLDSASRPRLAARARLRWDQPGNRYMLLFPEAALALNQSAGETLKLCDGNRTVDEIVNELAVRFGDEPRATIAEHVLELLTRISNRGLLEMN